MPDLRCCHGCCQICTLLKSARPFWSSSRTAPSGATECVGRAGRGPRWQLRLELRLQLVERPAFCGYDGFTCRTSAATSPKACSATEEG